MKGQVTVFFLTEVVQPGRLERGLSHTRLKTEFELPKKSWTLKPNSTIYTSMSSRRALLHL